MSVNEEAWEVLEFYRLRTILAGCARTGPGRRLLEELVPDLVRSEIEAALREVSELRAFLEQQGAIPVDGSEDLVPLLQRVDTPGSRLEVRELLIVRRSIAAAIACRRQLHGLEAFPALAGLGGRLEPLSRLAAELAEALDDEGKILDNASFELGEVRRDLRKTREQLRALLEGVLGDGRWAEIFQERLITERNGRAVLPVKADFRGRLKGFVHDESGSGQTLYIEPAVALELNNRVATLLRAEQREIDRILTRLSARVSVSSTELLGNQQILARLDMLWVVGLYAVRCNAHPPRLLEHPGVALKEARHPLLLLAADGGLRDVDVVPVDLLLPAGKQTLVVSGPNTGGKTVALKTFGLLVLMVRAGLPVPCHADSELYPFPQVFADIGDEQSIEASLSTFSGHIDRLVRIVRGLEEGALVLLDELGTGTDPAEGGALALAILDELHARGAWTVVTTHLNVLKGYAHVREGVENAAVEFDPETLAPSYRLHYGVPGASSAFTIARRLGLPEEVLLRAAEYLGESEREGLELIEDLNRMRSELEQDRSRARSDRENAQRERARRKQLLDSVERERGHILDKAVKRAEGVVRNAERQVQEVLRQARTLEGDKPRSAQLKADLKDVRSELARHRPQPEKRGVTPVEVENGELLWVVPLSVDATVVRDCGREIELDLHGKRTRVKRENLEQYQPRRFSPGTSRVVATSSVTRDVVSPRLVVVGVRVDDALKRLERFLDDALIGGLRQVEIVHGSGSGRLREALRGALRDHRAVTAFCAAAPEQGGDNVTVAELVES